jgi:hypothetical protein
MKLEQQVCSLDLSRKLKELGAKQESLFWWNWGDFGESSILSMDNHPRTNVMPHVEKHAASAFTVAELGEMLPLENVYPNIVKTIEPNGTWAINFTAHHQNHADTEADARAKMLCYLVENKLIPSQT